MKTIKFDLKLKNGEITLRTLDDLEENLSPELFTHFHSGKLAKWLRVRKLDELAEKLEALRAQHLEDKNELDVKLFKNLCEIFVSEVSEEDAREAIAEFHALPLVQIENIEEIEESKNLMVIEQPKTKEFQINERLLYKTFMELGGKGANKGSIINYAKGEIEPSEALLKLLEEFSIDVDTVLICRSTGKYGEKKYCLLTNDYLIFIGEYGDYLNTKILLKNTSHLNFFTNFVDKEDESVFLVDDHIYLIHYSMHSFYLFLVDYLAFEFNDKFERIEAK